MTTVINTTKTVNTCTDTMSLASVLEKIINPDHMVKNSTINVDNSNVAKILCRAVGSLKGSPKISKTMKMNKTNNATNDWDTGPRDGPKTPKPTMMIFRKDKTISQ